MRVTRTLRSDCGANIDCDKIFDTDDPRDLLVQGRLVELAEVDRTVPAGEGLLRVSRTVLGDAIGGAPMLDLSQLATFIGEHHSNDLFRLETLDDYGATSDATEYASWRRGEPGPDLRGKRAWLDRLAADHRAGRRWRRVHLLRRPLTDYLHYELSWCYLPNTDAGEDIRILDLTDGALPDGIADVGDFYVVDGTAVARMHYDADRFVGASVVDRAPEVFVAVRDLLWHVAEPFAAWWERHPDLHGPRAA